MNDHFILCGFGRIGREIAAEFAAGGVAFVIVDINDLAAERDRDRLHGIMQGTPDI